MTDSTQDPGSTADEAKTPHQADAGQVDSPDAQPAAAPSADAQPTDAQPPAAQPPAAQPPAAQAPDAAQPTAAYDVPPTSAAAETPPVAPADSTGPTDANGTDAFGRAVPGASAAGDPNTAQQAYAADAYSTDAYPAEQAGHAPTTAPARRKGSVALVAALAIGALVGGASGAGVTALVLSNQRSGIPVSQANGPSNVVVNNGDSVTPITAVAAKASPSVVTISVASGSAGGTGSGVILSKDGYVLTNTHVVTLDGAVADAKIQVTSNDGKLYKATLVGTDPISDLAVIKLTDASGLTPINWADSSKLNVGDTAIAIGAPLGLAGTVTNGIVSALNRSITVASSAAPPTPNEQKPDENGQSPFDFWNFDLPKGDGSQQPEAGKSSGSISLPVIQTDAAINPGNSGGALLNGKGELIGINVAIANAGGSSSTAAGSIGVGFAVPSNLAQRISDELIADGKATHGLLGASVTGATNDAKSSTVGALIAEISPGGAADKVGLKKGDIVTNFNGVPITDANDLTAQVRALAAGATTDLVYVRDGKSVTVSVTLGELSP